MSGRVGVVTGANRGIGKSVVELLATGPHASEVVLGCRDVQSGNKAKDEILSRHPGSRIVVEQLDIGDASSVDRFAADVRRRYPEGVDFIVNNAGFAYSGESSHVPFVTQAEETVGVNYFGTLRTIKALLPTVRSSTSATAEPPRIVSFASMAGQMAYANLSDALRKRFVDAKTENDITVLMEEFLSDVRAGVHSERGWPTNSYGMSKLGLIALTRASTSPGAIAEWAGGTTKDGTVFTCMCPGWCLSDMSVAFSNQLDTSGARSTEQGAGEATHLALPSSLGGDSRQVATLRGKFIKPIQKVADDSFAKGKTGPMLSETSAWTDGILLSAAHGGQECPPLQAKL